ncbi:MAG: 4Fe-4S binding protein [Mogibacterium sp.]|nr:4Fe-4S binding protein [Mogibacterium sp.]
MIRNVIALYFSPSGETAKITKKIANEIAERMNDACVDGVDVTYLDLLKEPPRSDMEFSDETIAVIGMPVFLGRIPLPCVKLLQKMHGNGTLTVATVTYGNSTYGDSLYELYSFAEDQGFNVVSAGAFISQHAIFNRIAEARPDIEDLQKIIEFSSLTAKKLRHFCGTSIRELRAKPAPLEIKGSLPTRMPLRLPIHPSANDLCVHCGKCAEICPVGAIDPQDPNKINARKCISCTACIRACEQGARGFFGPMSAASRLALEMLYSRRKDPEWFL